MTLMFPEGNMKVCPQQIQLFVPGWASDPNSFSSTNVSSTSQLRKLQGLHLSFSLKRVCPGEKLIDCRLDGLSMEN